MRSLLLVRNGVDHDARVLRAARVAQSALGGRTLIVGVATTSAPRGPSQVEGVEVLRLATQMPIPGRRARRTASGLSYMCQALRVARRVRPTLVHANDWNTMWTGLAIKLLWGSRLVYDSHELWPDRNGRWEWRPWLLISEALFVRAADAAITASPGYSDAIGRRYRVPAPMVIRNIPEAPTPSGEPVEPQPPEPLIVYVGGLMPGRGLEQAVDALALAPQMRLRAVGPGSAEYRTTLLQRAARAGVADRLELRPAVAPGMLGAVLADAAAGLCLIQPVCRSYELTLPNKLFEYAAAGVPVIAADLPVIASIVQEWGIGEVVPAGDPSAIAAGLGRLADPAARAATLARLRAFGAAHTWEREARRLGAVYTRVAEPLSPVVHSARRAVK